ncbi:MAG TPA: hypothetical protein VGV60_11540 [Candidatus Polarisedimenticolia bacterium]|nr:hypothetical protein [Candidatus Polarisedimenticolia bacterium]
MRSAGRETLVFTLPGDPALSRLARLVASHFLRQNGIKTVAARRGALAVEKGLRKILKSAARSGRSGRGVVLVLQPRPAAIEVTGRAVGGPKTRLLRLMRPRPS